MSPARRPVPGLAAPDPGRPVCPPRAQWMLACPVSLIRAAAAQFRCEAPLSTTQKTRLAEAYGSACVTWSTSAVNGLMPWSARTGP